MTAYIGTATSRIDGRAKVTGEAKYAAEYNFPGLAHGYVVDATIPRGRITSIDTSAALRVGGVSSTSRSKPPSMCSSYSFSIAMYSCEPDTAPESSW